MAKNQLPLHLLLSDAIASVQNGITVYDLIIITMDFEQYDMKELFDIASDPIVYIKSHDIKVSESIEEDAYKLGLILGIYFGWISGNREISNLKL